ncbi:uracil-xanthine permease family protein [Dysgonomonas sp. 511]|uniref:uracil-xanthine permease family protein n=1 Tax=Dysgonomonas sp. 511 TaxID=2302930 RepID=UPI0013D8128E|nr:solute carrier family 23 protein [Dysgonomonas sp. 511]NDV77543.1 xanthine permease [Dysgonomonas sp. 511]
MKYDVDEKLKPGAMLLYGLQWWVVTIPAVITMGLVLGKTHFGGDAAAQAFYMQKLFFIMGATLLMQMLAGHRLPLVIGPASVLLIGILASLSASVASIYTAIIIGGILLTLITVFGLLKYFERVFTSRVIIVIMLLIPITLGPTIVNLIFKDTSSAVFDLLFVLITSIALLLLNHLLKGMWKSITLVIGILVASLAYNIMSTEGLPVMQDGVGLAGKAQSSLFIALEFDAGVILAFVFCTIALMINELGSIQAVGQMVNAKDLQKRQDRGVAVMGVSNIFAGFLGVVGSIDYSSSPGIIASSGCASRFPFIPTAILLIICAFTYPLIELLLSIPNVVMGTILLYVMISQFSAGLGMCVRNKAVADFNDGAIIGLPLMVAILISFMPKEASAQIPSLVRPILCNGFVMGVITVFLMEHIVYPKRNGAKEKL